MKRQKFRLSHSVIGLVVLVAAQGAFIYAAPAGINAWMALLFGLIGAWVMLYVATEVIEEVRKPVHMFVLLGAVVIEFVLFFAVEYGFLLVVSPGSFPMLAPDIVSLLLHSTMVFVFNPLWMPGNFIGRAFLLINTLSSLGLVLFILQNVSQLRRGS